MAGIGSYTGLGTNITEAFGGGSLTFGSGTSVTSALDAGLQQGQEIAKSGANLGQAFGTALSFGGAALAFKDGPADTPLGIAKQAAAVGSLIPGAGMIFTGIGLGLNVLEGLLPTEAEKRAGEEARQRVFANLARDMRNDFNVNSLSPDLTALTNNSITTGQLLGRIGLTFNATLILLLK